MPSILLHLDPSGSPSLPSPATSQPPPSRRRSQVNPDAPKYIFAIGGVCTYLSPLLTSALSIVRSSSSSPLRPGLLHSRPCPFSLQLPPTSTSSPPSRRPSSRGEKGCSPRGCQARRRASAGTTAHPFHPLSEVAAFDPAKACRQLELE
jgi:hypothetical protein